MPLKEIPLLHPVSNTGGNEPTSGNLGRNLLEGEIALNIPDGKIYVGTGGGNFISGKFDVDTLGEILSESNSTDGTDIDFGGNSTGINVPDPSDLQEIANKRYVDQNITGVDIFGSVRLASNGNDISLFDTDFVGNVDGVTVQDKDLILAKDQSDSTENGVFIYDGDTNTFSRAENMNEDAEVSGGERVYVKAGNNLSDTIWSITSDNPTLGSDPIKFDQTAGPGSVNPSLYDGPGLVVNGNSEFEVSVGDAVQILSDALEVALDTSGGTVTSSPTTDNPIVIVGGEGLNLAIDNDKVVTDNNNALTVDGTNLSANISVSDNGSVVLNQASDIDALNHLSFTDQGDGTVGISHDGDAETYKGNDIDTDGDGKVNNADLLDGEEGTHFLSVDDELGGETF